MNQVQHFDNGFVLLKEDKGLSSPLSVVYYEYYDHLQEVKEYLRVNQEQIQCIASNLNITEGVVPFGKTQQPELWDYADDIDTLAFLLNLS